MYVLVILFVCCYTVDSYAKALFTWSQVVSENNLSIRSIVDGGVDCPAVIVDDEESMMNVRSLPDSVNGFYEKVCESIVDRSATKIIVDGESIPVLKKEINKIAIIGDTGCRVSSVNQQDCKSSSDWPFLKIIRAIASHNPDLTIHVGDYLYREKKCRDEKQCGKVYGDRFWTWKADWFFPARLLFSKTVFLFVRGNHESCNRSYKGWFRYLNESVNVSKFLDNCVDFTDSWNFNIDKLSFQVLDSSSFDDFAITDQVMNDVRDKFLLSLQGRSEKDIWLLTHRPIWSYVHYGKSWKVGYYYGNIVQQESFGSLLSDSGISNVLSGHAHIAQILNIDNAVNQFVVGNSGSSLYGQEDLSDKNFLKIGNFTANFVKNIKGFGFAIMDLKNYIMTFYDSDNNKMYEYSVSK